MKKNAVPNKVAIASFTVALIKGFAEAILYRDSGNFISFGGISAFTLYTETDFELKFLRRFASPMNLTDEFYTLWNSLKKAEFKRSEAEAVNKSLKKLARKIIKWTKFYKK